MTEKSPGGLIARTAAAHPPARRPRATGCRRLSGPVAAIAAAACAVVPSLATAATPAAAAGKPAPVLYVSDVNARPGTITPVSTATNKPGKPIKVGGSLPDEMAATPNGATVYVADLGSNTVTPVSVATNTAGKPIKVGPFPELRLVVLDALATLPPKARAVVVLRYWEDLSVEQVAELLGCSTGNVKSQSARSLGKLRALLGDAAAEECPPDRPPRPHEARGMRHG